MCVYVCKEVGDGVGRKIHDKRGQKEKEKRGLLKRCFKMHRRERKGGQEETQTNWIVLKGAF